MEAIEWDGKPVKRGCSGCGSKNYYEIRTMIQGTDVYDTCSDCKNPVSTAGIPDVYLPRAGMTFQALCDKNGTPIPIQSKRHKQQVMNELGLQEHPDRLKGKTWIEGSKDYRKRNFEEARPKIKESYRQYLDNVKRRRS